MTDKIFETLPPKLLHLKQLVKNAREINSVSDNVINQSIALIDHTTLKDDGIHPAGTETEKEIKNHCAAAIGSEGKQAACVCVYTNQITTARNALKASRVKIAVVNNFPHGLYSVAQAAEEAINSIELGADEIDTVIDYDLFLSTQSKETRNLVQEKLKAVSKVCKSENVKLKIILKASVYLNAQDLYDAAQLACECGANFVKTCTGKMPAGTYTSDSPDTSTLETAAITLQAVANYNAQHNTKIGVKISGGVSTALDCAQFKCLVEHILGKDFYEPRLFRYGASSLLGNLTDGPHSTSLQTSDAGY